MTVRSGYSDKIKKEPPREGGVDDAPMSSVSIDLFIGKTALA
ncbi:hypothetical protein HKBW3S42_01673, partial [Candidatus Hakubella thermalkaliphila]